MIHHLPAHPLVSLRSQCLPEIKDDGFRVIARKERQARRDAAKGPTA
jgi:hypothetical protein